MTDLELRLEKAHRSLIRQAETTTAEDEANRLRGKCEGIDLALAYLREELRIARAVR